MYINALDSNHITIRRNWIGTTDYPYRPRDIGYLGYGIQIYRSDDCIVENNFVRMLEQRKPLIGIWNFTHYYNNPGYRNKFYGNIVDSGPNPGYDNVYGNKAVQHRSQNNIFLNNVAIDSNPVNVILKQ